MNILCIIPARMGSSRFPGKPLAPLLGKPMIGHVYERVSRCRSLTTTVVATCDSEIEAYVSSIGGRVVMTGRHHERASDRCAEALQIMEQEDGVSYDIVIMVQGDEPMTDPRMIDEAIKPMLEDPSIQVVNLMAKVESSEEFEDQNCIKVVCDLQSNALYFSREPIPTKSQVSPIPQMKQVCIIPFRKNFLLEYIDMMPTPLEVAESIDMMRILEHGIKVHMVLTDYATHAVDTPEDMVVVEKLMTKKS